MEFNRFRLQIIIRSLLIGLSAFLFFYMLSNGYTVTAIFVLLLSGLQIYLLIKFAEKTNHDLSRFLSSIEFGDFSQSFHEKNSEHHLKNSTTHSTISYSSFRKPVLKWRSIFSICRP